ncbi:MAG: hybrid sensor histidine kinase/response regulator [Cyanobacteria bacterium J06560_2]
MTATQDWSDLSLLGLFRLEVETQARVISDHLLSLEAQGQMPIEGLDALMRAAHSIKGAARIVQVEAVVCVAHVLEDFFVSAQQGTLALSASHVDALLQASDFMLRLSALEESALVDQAASYEVETQAIVLVIEGLSKGVMPPVVSPAASVALPAASVESVKEEEEKEKETSSETSSAPVPDNLELRPEINIDHRVEENTAPLLALNVAPSSTETLEAVTVDLKDLLDAEPAKKTARMIRMNADNLNRLMGLAGESLVESNWLQPFALSLRQLKQQQQSALSILQGLHQPASQLTLPGELESVQAAQLADAIAHMQRCQHLLSDQLGSLDLFSQRFGQLSDRLYRELIASHMCAFEVGTQGYSRLTRDVAKTLGKQVRLEIEGLNTQVDRDILEKLDAPMTHLITNAIAHGIEPAEARVAAGKSAVGTLRIAARHRAGMLRITVEDDGGGIDFAQLRQKIVLKGMTPAAVVDQLSEAELIEFLFLPGFSTAAAVDQLSGRGYGLDIARNMVQSVGGSLVATSVPGGGTCFQFQLPLTLSVVRSLLFEVAEEPYALSLARIGRVLKLSSRQILYGENKPYFSLSAHSEKTLSEDGLFEADHAEAIFSKDNAQCAENISLVSAVKLLGLTASDPLEAAIQCSGDSPAKRQSQRATDIWVIVLGDPGSRYGICVDQLIEEKDLVVRPLDARLGKVPNVSSAALTEKGEPILILDGADLLRSAAKVAASEHAAHPSVLDNRVAEDAAEATSTQKGQRPPKRVLVVDDSMTVRAMEQKLLKNRGYDVDIAVNGAEGWNSLQVNTYDLLITDVDMPRMNGIELIEHLRAYAPTQKLPVIVVSYKDREEDQLAGLNAGANYYLTKSSFHDDGLINAVVDLIGEAGP